MFTGIIETTAEVLDILPFEQSLQIWLSAPIQSELYIDQSLAHNGICLTIDQMEAHRYRITAIDETLKRTTISGWKIGDRINLERSLQWGGRLDGHLVQGHVDTSAECVEAMIDGEIREFRFQVANQFGHLFIEKGSIALDGISLTCHALTADTFKVSLIPYTFEHTNAAHWTLGKKINVEFDMVGKYLERYQNLEFRT